MKKEMNKKAQFYLVFALIAVALIGSFIAVKNFSQRDELTDLEITKQEIQTESQYVLDYITKTGDNKLDNFTEEISNHYKNKEIIFITGEPSGVNVYKYEDGNKETFEDTWNKGNEVTVQVNQTNYTFNLKNAENFYFIVKEQKEDEVYIETN